MNRAKDWIEAGLVVSAVQSCRFLWVYDSGLAVERRCPQRVTALAHSPAVWVSEGLVELSVV